MSKLYKTKRVDFKAYTGLELAFLAQELMREIDRRVKATPKLMQELNERTFELTHAIELEPVATKTEKVNRYNTMEQHFRDRRTAKQEDIVSHEVLKLLDTKANRQKFGIEVNKKQRYFALEDGDRVVRPSEWKRFYDEFLEPYM